MNPSTITDAALLTLQQMSGFVHETLLTTFVSLMITYLLVAKGFLKHLADFSKPFTARIGLPDTVIAASLVALGSVLSANAMLSELYRQRQITEKDTYLGAILNGTSLNVKQIFTYQLPIMVPLLGWKAGGIYLLCFVSAAVIRYCYVLFHVRQNSQVRNVDFSQADSHAPRTTMADSRTKCNKDEPGDGWLRMPRHHGRLNRQVQVARCTSTSAEKNDTKFTVSD